MNSNRQLEISSKTAEGARRVMAHCIERPNQKVLTACLSVASRVNCESAICQAAARIEVPLNWFEPHKCRLANGSQIIFELVNEEGK